MQSVPSVSPSRAIGHSPTADARLRRGFTLVELLMGAVIASLLSVILGGLVLAVQTARQHTEGLHTSMQQFQAITERMRWMISQAGSYRLTGSETVAGVRVAQRDAGIYSLPEMLVVWSGGRTGGQVDQGESTRLPIASELVVYAPDPDQPQELCEFVFPSRSDPVDFSAADFDSVIRDLVQSTDAEAARLSDRLRRVQLTGFLTAGEDAAGIRFEVTQSPTDEELELFDSGAVTWESLRWPQNMVNDSFALRQLNVRIEMQLESRHRDSLNFSEQNASTPFFATIARRYAYTR